MSFLKNLGAISYYAQCGSLEMFISSAYYILQPKQWYSHIKDNKIPQIKDALNRTASSYNEAFQQLGLTVYDECNKLPVLLLQRDIVTPWNIKEDSSISAFVSICMSVIRAYKIAPFLASATKLNENLFFRFNSTQDFIYLHPHLPQPDSTQRQPDEVWLIAKITELLENISIFKNTYPELLLNRMKKTKSLKEFQQEINYFINICEIKGHETHSVTLTKRHRKYTKNCRDEVIETVIMKNKIDLRENTNKRGQGFSFCDDDANRSRQWQKSLSKAGTRTARPTFSSFHKSSKTVSMFHQAKASTHRSFSSHSIGFSYDSRSSQAPNNLKESSFSAASYSSKVGSNKQNKKRLNQNLNDDFSDGLSKKQLTNKNLLEMKEKRLKLQQNKKMLKNSKPIVRKNLAGMQYAEKAILCQQPNEPVRKIQQESQALGMNSIASSNENYHFHEAQEKTEKQKVILKSFHPVQKQSIQKVSSLPQNQLKQTQTEKLPQNKVFQNSKSNLKSLKPTEIIENAIIKNLKFQLLKINYVGQCVSRMPASMKKLKTSDQYLWQLPAFLLYKQFYSMRLQLYEGARVDKSTDQNKTQIARFMSQFQKQNEEAKQSLSKLLKSGLKKMKKIEMVGKNEQDIKHCLNLDFTKNWHRHLDQVVPNFISELEETRAQDPEALTILIDIIDAYLICKQSQFNPADRKAVKIEEYNDEKTIQYFHRKVDALCALLKNC